MDELAGCVEKGGQVTAFASAVHTVEERGGGEGDPEAAREARAVLAVLYASILSGHGKPVHEGASAVRSLTVTAGRYRNPP